ncbi:MAG: AzlC family ABC transporter permease [Peptococcaceae bacterium]|nr:AzlC family ABC transporter permease [Peptococcaceae bacterium]
MSKTAVTAEQCQTISAPETFAGGLKAGVPIAVGYIPIAVAFGLMAKAAEIPNHITILMSLAVFAGVSQFVGVGLMAAGVAPWEIIMTTFIINLRHLLMSASISRRIHPGVSKKLLSVLAFGITDETFSVASFRKERQINAEFVLGLNLLAFSAWNVGTWAGIFLATGLPELVKSSMGIALYAMFIGLLVPTLKKSAPVLTIVLLALIIHSVLYWVPLFSFLSTGWKIIITTIVAAAAGAAVFPGGVGE